MLETMRCVVNQDVFTGMYWATLLGGEFDNCCGRGDSEISAIRSLRIRIHQLRHKKYAHIPDVYIILCTATGGDMIDVQV